MSAANRVRYRRARGFTLIELMIVVVITAILASIASPFFKGFVARQKIKTTSFDIMSSLMLARSEAIKRNTDVSVTPTSSNWQNGWTVAVSTTTLARHEAFTDLTVTCRSDGSVVASCPAITYNHSGRLSGSTAPSIELSSGDTDSSGTRCISIDLSGRPHGKKAGC